MKTRSPSLATIGTFLVLTMFASVMCFAWTLFTPPDTSVIRRMVLMLIPAIIAGITGLRKIKSGEAFRPTKYFWVANLLGLVSICINGILWTNSLL